MNKFDSLHADLTEGIIRCYYLVYNQLRYGFLEKVYENALKHELEKNGYVVEAQKRIDVFYDGIRVGEYFADMVVNDKVIIELKAAESLCDDHAIQLLNYLRATNLEVGLLLNFGKQPQVSRKQFLNDAK
ncbi:GxxExxY protein [Candidatus Nomurabacteria bacterium]|nr:GxxExxY protein [Candidatus Nomurabacteria bacterium]